MVIENAFGLLKNRFHRLKKFTEQSNLAALTYLIACLIAEEAGEFDVNGEAGVDGNIACTFSAGVGDS